MLRGLRGRRAVATVAAVLAVSALSVPGSRAGAEVADSGLALGRAGGLAVGTAGGEITLITGDQVHLRAVDGGHQAVTITPAPRADGSVPNFQVLEADGQLSVIPDDVAALVPQRLDAALFDVSELAEDGYDAAIPLILTYDGNTTKSAIPAVKQLRTLESIGGAGVSIATHDAARFGAALAGLAAGTAARAASPLAGVSKIWLDRKVEPVLENSVPADRRARGVGGRLRRHGHDRGRARHRHRRHPSRPGREDRRPARASSRRERDRPTPTATAPTWRRTIAGTGAASDGRRKGVAPGRRAADRQGAGRRRQRPATPGSSTAWSGRRARSTPRSST